MFPAATKQAGMATGMPDVCKTPTPAGPIPIPYPNIAQFNQANPGTTTQKVKVANFPAFTQATVVPISTGDEPGSAGGVISGTIKGEAKFIRFSVKVKFENKFACFLTGTMTMNKMNVMAGIHCVPSQTKVLIAM